MVTFVIYVASNHNSGAFNYLFHSNMYISYTYISFILLVIFPLPIFFSSRLERERATDSSIRDLALSPRPCILSRAETASNLSRITSQTCPRPRRLASNAAVLIPRWDFYRARKFDDPNANTRAPPRVWDWKYARGNIAEAAAELQTRSFTISATGKAAYFRPSPSLVMLLKRVAHNVPAVIPFSQPPVALSLFFFHRSGEGGFLFHLSARGKFRNRFWLRYSCLQKLFNNSSPFKFPFLPLRKIVKMTSRNLLHLRFRYQISRFAISSRPWNVLEIQLRISPYENEYFRGENSRCI